MDKKLESMQKQNDSFQSPHTKLTTYEKQHDRINSSTKMKDENEFQSAASGSAKRMSNCGNPELQFPMSDKMTLQSFDKQRFEMQQNLKNLTLRRTKNQNFRFRFLKKRNHREVFSKPSILKKNCYVKCIDGKNKKQTNFYDSYSFKNYQKNPKLQLKKFNRPSTTFLKNLETRDIKIPVHKYASYHSPTYEFLDIKKLLSTSECSINTEENNLKYSRKIEKKRFEKINPKRRYFLYDAENNFLIRNPLEKKNSSKNLKKNGFDFSKKTLQNKNLNAREIKSTFIKINKDTIEGKKNHTDDIKKTAVQTQSKIKLKTCINIPNNGNNLNFNFKILEKVFYLINKLMTTDKINENDLKMPETQKRLVLAFLNKKNPYTPLKLTYFTKEMLNLYRQCEKKKRKEERLKYIFKKSINHMQGNFKKQLPKWQQIQINSKRDNGMALDYLFYEHYFGQIARQLGVPIEKFFHFRNWKTRVDLNIPKSITKAYIRLISLNPKFISEIFYYIKNLLLKDVLRINSNKVASIVSKWEYFILKYKGHDAYQKLEEKIKSKRYKFPWGIIEIQRAIEDTLNYFYKSNIFDKTKSEIEISLKE